MKKLIITIIITLTAFIGFNLTAKASELLFKYKNGSSITNPIELAGDEYVEVSLYVTTSSNIYGAVIPWSVGDNLQVVATSPVENNEDKNGNSILYKTISYTPKIVIDSSEGLTSNGEIVKLADFKISAPNLSEGSESTISLGVSSKAQIAGKSTSSLATVDTGTTLTIRKKGTAPTPTYKKGDWDNNGVVNQNDAVNIFRYAMGWPSYVNYYISNSLGDAWRSAMNVNGVGQVDQNDAVAAFRIAMHLMN